MNFINFALQFKITLPNMYITYGGKAVIELNRIR